MSDALDQRLLEVLLDSWDRNNAIFPLSLTLWIVPAIGSSVHRVMGKCSKSALIPPVLRNARQSRRFSCRRFAEEGRIPPKSAPMAQMVVPA